MGEVIEINQKRCFSLGEAQSLLPVIRRITKGAYDDVKRLNTQLGYLHDRDKLKILEEDIQSVFREWHQKMVRLGVDAKGMWLVDFDNGDGYYCWHYPEPTIDYIHGYFDGYRGRVRIT